MDSRHWRQNLSKPRQCFKGRGSQNNHGFWAFENQRF